LNRLRLPGLLMSDVSIVFIAVAVAAVIYVLSRIVGDWLSEEPGLPPESKAVVAGILSLLLWYRVYFARNSLGIRRSWHNTTVGLVQLLLLLLLTLILWQARRG